MRILRRLCVYCASAPGGRAVYLDAARSLGRLLAERGVELVYGGANVGLMGAVANAALDAGGRVIGVIPRPLVEREVAHHGVTDLRLVDTMHERKALMHELSDGFVALPGGLGTLEELLETLTWAQLGMHDKATGLLNVAGYYDGLLQLLDHGVAEGLIAPANRAMLLAADDAHALLARLEAYEPPPTRRWIVRGQE